jgi:tetratricopeptide (TPR) repeat protein
MKKNKKLILILGIVWTTLVAMVYLYEFLHSIVGFSPLPESKIIRLFVILLIGLAITAIIMLLNGYLSIGLNLSGKGNEKPKFSLVDEIFEADKNEQYEKVIRIGTNICRTLYIEGHHKLRHDVGKLIQEAAVKTQNRDVEVEAYIDHIGWSLVLMRGVDNSKAVEYINHGIALAKHPPSNSFWIAKGTRHLGAIRFIAHDYRNAEAILREAITFAEGIENENQKKEMIAGIDFDLALIKLKLSDTDSAEAFCSESRALREEVGDKSRICRVFALEGKIAEAKNDKIVAKNFFSQGLEYAKKQNRKDELIRNHIGLARILKDEDTGKAKEHYELAKNLLNDTDAPFDIYGEEDIPML